MEQFGERETLVSQAAKKTADWEAALVAARDGRLDDIPAAQLIRCYSTLKRIASDAEWKRASGLLVAPEIQLRVWQQTIIDELQQPPHPRRIVFVVDIEGGAGKSTFAQYLSVHFGNQLIRLHPARGADLAYCLDRPYKYFIVDCPRGSQEFMPWSFLESVKDGYVVSTKYESAIKTWPHPHLYIFTNSSPPENVLSKDRVVQYFVDSVCNDFIEKRIPQ